MSSSIPSFEYRHATAPQREQSQKFTDALLKSGAFYRDSASLLHLKTGPNDFVRIANKAALREILTSARFVRLTGDDDDPAFDTLWSWAIARLWVFPRLDPDKPRDKPRPVRHEPYHAPRLGGERR